MDGNMDVLSFSLSCDHCEFRTKSMSIMRDHAQRHSAEQHDQRPGDDIGMSNHVASDDHAALQALVDSALNDASRLLLSSPENTHHHHHHHHLQDPSSTSNQNSVEEACRTGGHVDAPGIGHQGRKTERVVTPRASALAAEDLLGIYAAGIDLSVVGQGVGDGQFEVGCSQESQAVMSTAIEDSADISTRIGVDQDCAGSRIHPRTEDSGYIDTGGESEQQFRKSSGNYSTANGPNNYRRHDSVQEKERISCAVDATTKTYTSQSRDTNHFEKPGKTQMLRGKKSNRPLFHFVIHPSAFSKTQPAEDEMPQSSSSSKERFTHNEVDPREAYVHESSTMDNVFENDLDKADGATKAVRTQEHRSDAESENEGTTNSGSGFGRRRRRKLVPPLKIVVPQSKENPSSKQSRQKVCRFRGRTKASLEKPKYTCPECNLLFKLMKDLKVHVKLVHTKSGKDSELKRAHPKKNKLKLCGETVDKGKPLPRRSLRQNVLDSCKSQQKVSLSKPRRRLLKKEDDQRKNVSRCKRKPSWNKLPSEDELEEQKENEDEDWVPEAAEMSSSDGEGIDSGREVDGNDDVFDVSQITSKDCSAIELHKPDEHMTSLPNSKGFRCNYCSYTCQSRKTLASHIDHLHSDKSTQKTKEPKTKGKKKDLDTNRVYRCSICNFSCHSSHLLNSHMKSAHNFEKMSGEFTCGVCGKVIVGRFSHFRRHLRCHSEERPYKCDQCPLAFRDANSLNCHLPIHKEERDYLCEDCGMAFKRPINLRMHRKVHSDKMFSCDECDYKCRRRNTLQNHKKRKHLKQKSVLCQHCGHRFFSKTECKNHVLKKHTQRPTPFACPICPAVFMFQYRFKAHLKTHPEIKPYKCHYCGFETRLNTYLMDHMRQHTGEKPKKCNLCDYETSTNSNLYKHKKRHHGPGAQRVSSRTRKPRSNKNDPKDGNLMAVSEEQKQRTEKSVVEDIVNAVEFGQMASQVNLTAGGQVAAAMYNMATMCSTQEFKQEQLMQVSTDVHQGPSILPDEVISSVSDPSHDVERLSITNLDKAATSSVAAMMEALADARNMRPPQLHQPNHQTLLSHPSGYPIHLTRVTTPQPSTLPASTSATTIFPRSVATNMTMHYVHPNIGPIGGGGGYHHLSTLAGEAANRSPITSHSQPMPHNVTVPPPLIGVGQGQTTPQPLTHFSNIMHY
ncbi:zinc finger protein 814-like [Lytechinus pictus]|uniref:zinc finger protein 814-like n=1 Tax=Lytechinus pictus TaxID=7653 RepID=UPI0030B9F8CA